MSNGTVNPLLPNPVYNLGKLYKRKEEKELSGSQSSHMWKWLLLSLHIVGFQTRWHVGTE